MYLLFWIRGPKDYVFKGLYDTFGEAEENMDGLKDDETHEYFLVGCNSEGYTTVEKYGF